MAPDSPEIGKTLELGGFAINYHDHGRGEPVLLLHGSGPGVTAWANWRALIPELAAAWTALPPGPDHGNAAAVARRAAERQAEAASAFLAAMAAAVALEARQAA